MVTYLDLEIALENLAKEIAFEKSGVWPKWSDVENHETSRGMLAQQIRVEILEFLQKWVIHYGNSELPGIF